MQSMLPSALSLRWEGVGDGLTHVNAVEQRGCDVVGDGVLNGWISCQGRDGAHVAVGVEYLVAREDRDAGQGKPEARHKRRARASQ